MGSCRGVGRGGRALGTNAPGRHSGSGFIPVRDVLRVLEAEGLVVNPPTAAPRSPRSTSMSCTPSTATGACSSRTSPHVPCEASPTRCSTSSTASPPSSATRTGAWTTSTTTRGPSTSRRDPDVTAQALDEHLAPQRAAGPRCPLSLGRPRPLLLSRPVAGSGLPDWIRPRQSTQTRHPLEYSKEVQQCGRFRVRPSDDPGALNCRNVVERCPGAEFGTKRSRVRIPSPRPFKPAGQSARRRPWAPRNRTSSVGEFVWSRPR